MVGDSTELCSKMNRTHIAQFHSADEFDAHAGRAQLMSETSHVDLPNPLLTCYTPTLVEMNRFGAPHIDYLKSTTPLLVPYVLYRRTIARCDVGAASTRRERRQVPRAPSHVRSARSVLHKLGLAEPIRRLDGSLEDHRTSPCQVTLRIRPRRLGGSEEELPPSRTAKCGSVKTPREFLEGVVAKNLKPQWWCSCRSELAP